MRAFAKGRTKVIGAAIACVAGFGANTAFGADGPSLNFHGVPGIVDMPSGAALAQDRFSVSTITFGPISRSSFGFQAAPWLSGSLRTTSVRNWNDAFCPPDCSGLNAQDIFTDRSLDLRFQILNEGQFLPSVTLGLMDIFGPGLQSAEFIAATKTIGRVAVTGGLGWGRLGTYRPIGAPFGDRPDTPGTGGLRVDQVFLGAVAPFAGIEWQINDRWTVKGEYSSDAYTQEADVRGTFTHDSPFNFGLEYQHSDMLRFGAFSVHGSEFGIAAQIILDPSRRPGGGIGGTGPTPVQPRIPFAKDPEAWAGEWVGQDGAQQILIENLTTFLKRSGIRIVALGYSAEVAQVRFANDDLDAEAQAVGRVARAMTHLMPASVERFEIVPMTGGVPMTKVVLQRSDIEALEFAGDNAGLILQRAQITEVGSPVGNLALNPALYPDFTWSARPYAKLGFLESELPISGEVGLRLAARLDLAPGIVLQGSATKIGFSAYGANSGTGPGTLHPVRSDIALYRQNADPAIETLTASWHGRLGANLYGRLTAGYMEQMFAGVSSEVLWWPTGRPFAIGAELNLLAQRDTNGGLGFSEYDFTAASGHLSGYFDLGRGYLAQVDLGRYLAGDMGGTLTLTRRFETGWALSAHTTLTDATDVYGADQGIRIQIPTSWLTGQPSRTIREIGIKPFTGDAGARFSVDDRLYDLLIDESEIGLREQWGRFWK